MTPYIGLRSFGPDDGRLFFGRDRLVNDVLLRLNKSNFLAVLGQSGAGKSSLIRAGVIPKLEAGLLDWESDPWKTIEMRPGDRPIEALADCLHRSAVIEGYDDREGLVRLLTGGGSALALVSALVSQSSGERLLLLVDQFEETFRYARGAGSAAAGVDAARARSEAEVFVDLLISATAHPKSKIYVVLTMRTDYLGECSEVPQLADMVSRNVFLVPRMTEAELADAIRLPAGVAGGEVEDGLVNRLLIEARDKGGGDALPLLQHAMLRLWEKAERGGPKPRLTLAALEEMTSAEEALSSHLESTYQALPAELQPVAEALFRRVTRESEGRLVRDPASLGEIAHIAGLSSEQVRAVVHAFSSEGRHFLAPQRETPQQDDCIVDISHEAVIRSWPRLKEWVVAEAAKAERFRDLKKRAGFTGTDQTILYGARKLLNREDLAAAVKWRDEERPTASWASRYAAPSTLRVVLDLVRESELVETRESLRSAITDGDIEKLTDLLAKGARLDRDVLQDWDYAPHYHAICPQSINLRRGAGSTGRYGRGRLEFGEDNAEASISLDSIRQVIRPDCIGRSTLKGFTVQHYAAAGGDIRILTHLREIGADLDVLTEGGTTPFGIAAYNGCLDALKWLSEHMKAQGLDIHKPSKDLVSPCHWAALRGHADVVHWLTTEAGADARLQQVLGNTPLHYAVYCSKEGALRTVNTLLAAAPEAVKILNNDGMSPLAAALIWSPDQPTTAVSKLQIVAALLAVGANATDVVEGYLLRGLLHCAVENRSLDDEIEPIVEALIAAGAQPHMKDRNDEDAVTAAIAQGRIALAERLVKAASDHTPGVAFRWVQAAIKNRSAEAVAMLARCGVALNGAGEKGETALHLAAQVGRVDLLPAAVVRELRDVANAEGLTPMGAAIQAGNAAAIRALEQAGATLPPWVRLVTSPSGKEEVGPPSREEMEAALQAQLANPLAVWPSAPMIEGQWLNLGAAQASEVLAKFLSDNPTVAMSVGEHLTALRALPLRMYEGGMLYEALAPVALGGRGGGLTFMRSNAGWTRLNGVSNQIHDTNANAPIQLRTAEDVMQYLVFFCSAVHGEFGAFTIVTRPERVQLATATPVDEATLNTVTGVFEPLAVVDVVEEDGKKAWHVTACVKYSDAVFKAKFAIRDAGSVEMLDDEPAAVGLPLLSECYEDGLRTISARKAPAS